MDKALKKTFSFMDKLIEELGDEGDSEKDENKNIKENISGGKTEESKTFKSMN